MSWTFEEGLDIRNNSIRIVHIVHIEWSHQILRISLCEDVDRSIVEDARDAIREDRADCLDLLALDCLDAWEDSWLVHEVDLPSDHNTIVHLEVDHSLAIHLQKHDLDNHHERIGCEDPEVLSERFLIEEYEHDLAHNRHDQDELIRDRCIKIVDKVAISAFKVFLQVIEIIRDHRVHLEFSKVTNIIPRRKKENHCHENIPCDDRRADVVDLDAHGGDPDTEGWENEYNDGYPDAKKSKYPWPLDDHDASIPFRDKSLDEFCFSGDFEWFKEPWIDAMKWYHAWMIAIFFVFQIFSFEFFLDCSESSRDIQPLKQRNSEFFQNTHFV